MTKSEKLDRLLHEDHRSRGAIMVAFVSVFATVGLIGEVVLSAAREEAMIVAGIAGALVYGALLWIYCAD